MKKPLAPLLLAGGLASMWLGGCGTKPAPQPNNKSTNAAKPNATPNTATKTSNGRLKVIAFYDQTMSTVTPDPFSLTKAHPGLVTFLSPFWYEVSASGSIISKPEGNAATLAKQDHLPLMPLFNNAKGTAAFLHSSATRATAIHNIVSLVQSKHYPGVQIDFQLLKKTDRSDLTAFMTSLKKALPKNVSLSMSVVPLTSGNGQSSAYDFAALDKVVDSMVLMAYDLHGDGTPPGPVAPYTWVEKSITTATHAGIQPSKLYLGIADYGYLWKNGSTKAQTIPLKAMHQHKYGTYTWSSTYHEAYDKYTSKGTSNIIWFENDRAAAERIALAKKYHLGGVAFWRIGYEDAKWWSTVAGAIGNGSPTTQAARPNVSPQHAANNAANTLKQAGNKANNNLKKPTTKRLIAPTRKVKNSVKRATGK